MPQEISKTELCTGIVAIDNLHREFLRALEHLSSTPDHAFEPKYRAFVQTAEKTFGIEEAWMEDLDCAIIHAHREQHARVLGALHNVHARLMDGDITLGREVAEKLLPQWFAFHVSTMDVALGALLESAGAKVAIVEKQEERSFVYID